MKRGSERWFKVARGGAGVYAAAVPGLLLLMAMEPTPDLLRNTAWILTIIGLVVFVAVFTRLRYLQVAGVEAPTTSRTKIHYRDRTRTTFAMFAWFNLGVFVLCGLVWVFTERAQCLIQGWLLGRITAVGCS